MTLYEKSFVETLISPKYPPKTLKGTSTLLEDFKFISLLAWFPKYLEESTELIQLPKAVDDGLVNILTRSLFGHLVHLLFYDSTMKVTV